MLLQAAECKCNVDIRLLAGTGRDGSQRMQIE